MKGSYPVLLIGLLSMFFAEILSGASTTWFLDPAGILITFPLYMFHVIFLTWIAIEYGKANIGQLYLFGIIFALYEAWVTKVLWAGYMDSTGPGAGTFLGVGIAEFLVLVFFWHPMMSFLFPVMVYQILTGKVLQVHKSLLEKTRRRSALFILCILFFSTFVANGNSFDIISANMSVLGTLLLIWVVWRKAEGSDLMSVHLKKKHFLVVAAYLIVLYVVTFVLFLPERIPSSVTPYATVILFYFIPVGLLFRSAAFSIDVVDLPEGSYSVDDLKRHVLILLLAVNIACLVPSVSSTILAVTYFSMILAGSFLFLFVVSREIRRKTH